MAETIRAALERLLELEERDWCTQDWVDAIAAARAALAAEADGPAVPEGREPASVVGEPSDEELLRIAADAIDPYDKIGLGEYEAETECAVEAYGSELIAFARAVLARFGHQPAPPAEGEVAEVAAWLRAYRDEEFGPLSIDPDASWLTRAADLLEQRHPAPVPEEAANPWKDALIDALVCNFLLNKENESDPKKALHDLVSWETRLAGDPSINPLMRPVSVSERLPGPEDCDAEGRCWWLKERANPDHDLLMPTWHLQRQGPAGTRFFRFTHWLPATALPLPAGEVQP